MCWEHTVSCLLPVASRSSGRPGRAHGCRQRNCVASARHMRLALRGATRRQAALCRVAGAAACGGRGRRAWRARRRAGGAPACDGALGGAALQRRPLCRRSVQPQFQPCRRRGARTRERHGRGRPSGARRRGGGRSRSRQCAGRRRQRCAGRQRRGRRRRRRRRICAVGCACAQDSPSLCGQVLDQPGCTTAKALPCFSCVARRDPRLRMPLHM